jgi:hypothetical protein
MTLQIKDSSTEQHSLHSSLRYVYDQISFIKFDLHSAGIERLRQSCSFPYAAFRAGGVGIFDEGIPLCALMCACVTFGRVSSGGEGIHRRSRIYSKRFLGEIS